MVLYVFAVQQNRHHCRRRRFFFLFFSKKKKNKQRISMVTFSCVKRQFPSVAASAVVVAELDENYF